MRKTVLATAAALALSAAAIGAWAVLTAKPDATLTAITATSPASAWAIGYTGTQEKPSPLIEHWDGSSWQPTALPAGLGHAYLSGIAATSARDAWAVGDISGTAPSVLMLRWNGRSWHRVALPWNPRHGALTAVAAMSAGNVWAFGLAETKSIAESSQGLHWNGSRWQLTPGLPAPAGRVGAPSGLAFGPAASGWAVGSTYATQPVTTVATAAHTAAWQLRGGTWYPATIPGLLASGSPAVATTSPADAFATGFVPGLGETIDHWNGTRWTPMPGISYGHGITLVSLSALSPDDAWAAGEQLPKEPGSLGAFEGSPLGPVIMHWNGLRWTRSVTPSLNGASLNAVTATSPSNAWAIGQTGSNQPLILHWNGHDWTRQL